MKKLLAILTMAAGVWGGVAFTDLPDSTVYQFPHAGQTPGTFPLVSGTYTGSPASISAAVMDFNADTFIVEWTVIDASPSGGTFSETLTDIPKGGPYRLLVKSSIEGDTLRGIYKWGVGEVIGCFGQSNMMPMVTGGDAIAVNGFSVVYVNEVPKKLKHDWINSGTPNVRSILPACANKILSDISNAYPVAFCGYAQGGTSLADAPGNWGEYNAGNPYDPATLYGLLLTQIAAKKPNTIIMYQGESDVASSTATYISRFNTDRKSVV